MKLFKILTIGIFALFGSVLVLVGCDCSRTAHHTDGNDTAEISSFALNLPVENIETVNFYFENSASMNGYLDGNSFLETMIRIIGNIDDDKMNSFFVNTNEHKVDNILSRIEKKDIAVGDISKSDHQFIFKNAIENAIDNKLSIVVTDGIYSVNGRSPRIVSVHIETAFREALNNNEIETVILKLSSNFDGTYYSESCEPGHKAIPINQQRPYYVLLFGNSKVINKALNDIVIIDDLPDFKEQARFFITKNKEINYTVLTRGEEIHGTVIPADKHSYSEVISIEAEKYSVGGLFSSTPKDVNYLQFAIAINFSNYSLPNSYFIDTNNYEVDEVTGYQVIDVKKITELKKSSSTFKTIEKLDDNYTHIIVVKASSALYGELEIDLENNLPAWITNTGLENDCEINGNEEQTFAFDQLINGISKAYERLNDNEEYLKLEITIKPY